VPQLGSLDLTHKALAFHIAGYAAGCYETPGDKIERLRQVVLASIHFCQNFDFAPEIRSIITRRQFIIWAEGVSFALLRPYWQEAQALKASYPFTDGWSIGDWLLRSYPNRLDSSYTRTIHISRRIPEFARLWQLYPRPSDSVITSLRLDNHDAWRAQSSNNYYLDLESTPILGWVWVDSDEFYSTSGSDEESD
jgi:hypothetical protein